MTISTLRYTDRFTIKSDPNATEESVKAAFAARLKEVRGEQDISISRLAEIVGCSQATVSFWGARRVLPGIQSLERLHTRIGIDLNWLLRTERTLDEVAQRRTDGLRLSRIFERIAAISHSIRLIMFPQTKALIARAIYTASEHHEDALFELLQTSGSRGFTGHKWVMGLDEARNEELEMLEQTELTFGSRIKLVRLRLGLTNHGFSRTLGVPQTTWLTWENGRAPQLMAFLRAFGSLDVDLNWLIASTSSSYVPFGSDYDWEASLA